MTLAKQLLEKFKECMEPEAKVEDAEVEIGEPEEVQEEDETEEVEDAEVEIGEPEEVQEEDETEEESEKEIKEEVKKRSPVDQAKASVEISKKSVFTWTDGIKQASDHLKDATEAKDKKQIDFYKGHLKDQKDGLANAKERLKSAQAKLAELKKAPKKEESMNLSKQLKSVVESMDANGELEIEVTSDQPIEVDMTSDCECEDGEECDCEDMEDSEEVEVSDVAESFFSTIKKFNKLSESFSISELAGADQSKLDAIRKKIEKADELADRLADKYNDYKEKMQKVMAKKKGVRRSKEQLAKDKEQRKEYMGKRNQMSMGLKKAVEFVQKYKEELRAAKDKMGAN